MKFGTQLGSLGRSDRKEALALGKELGCQGLEVSLSVADLREGKTTLESLLSEAQSMRQDFEEAGVEVISLTPGILLKHVQHPEVVEGVCEVAKALGADTIRMFSAPHVRWGGPGSTLEEWMAEFEPALNFRVRALRFGAAAWRHRLLGLVPFALSAAVLCSLVVIYRGGDMAPFVYMIF